MLRRQRHTRSCPSPITFRKWNIFTHAAVEWHTLCKLHVQTTNVHLLGKLTWQRCAVPSFCALWLFTCITIHAQGLDTFVNTYITLSTRTRVMYVFFFFSSCMCENFKRKLLNVYDRVLRKILWIILHVQMYKWIEKSAMA